MLGPSPSYTHETVLTGSNPHVILRSNRLPVELRTPVLADTTPLLQLLTNPKNVEHDESASTLNSAAAVEQFIHESLRFSSHPNPELHDKLNLIIILDGVIIGLSGLGRINTDTSGRRSGDVGIMIDVDSRGKGYAEEALRVTFHYALRVLRLDEVVVACTGANVAIQGLMERRFGIKVIRQDPGNDEFGSECLYTVRDGDIK